MHKCIYVYIHMRIYGVLYLQCGEDGLSQVIGDGVVVLDVQLFRPVIRGPLGAHGVTGRVDFHVFLVGQ